MLYAIFISPLFDLDDLSAFADDNYSIQWHGDLGELKIRTEESLRNILKWMTAFGLKVNEARTELCLFSRHNIEQMTIKVGHQDIQTRSEMNVLGVVFDSKLKWGPQVANAISKSNKALNAIRLIRSFFSTGELLQLITSNFYSIFFYNSEVWHMKILHNTLKRQLLSHSAKAIKLCTRSADVSLISHNDLHEMAVRATPDRLMDYKLALQLCRTFNNQLPTRDRVMMNLSSVTTSRQKTFITNKTNRLKIGMNCIYNRFFYLNGKIDLNWLILAYGSYKEKCKRNQ